MSIKIGQASLGETGGRNQQPGHQTGRELNISNWYQGRWLGVLRYKSRKKAELAAQTCEAAIKNPNIGYAWTAGTRHTRPPEPSGGT